MKFIKTLVLATLSAFVVSLRSLKNQNRNDTVRQNVTLKLETLIPVKREPEKLIKVTPPEKYETGRLGKCPDKDGKKASKSSHAGKCQNPCPNGKICVQGSGCCIYDK